MSLAILGAGTFSAEELAAFPAPPAWRKATRNMIMSAVSVERALRQVPGLRVQGNGAVGFVCGSVSGELETSAEFMTQWSKNRLARPVLFQNSLHNATTGFVSIHFKLVGPAFTMSAVGATPAECLETARALLLEGDVEVCVVTLNEGHKTLAAMIGEDGVAEGACTLIVARAESARRSGREIRAELGEDFSPLNFSAQPRTAPLVAIDRCGFFDLARELEERP